MKKIFSLLLAFMATAAAMAQGTDRSILKLRLSDRSPLSVNIDGRYIDRQTTSLTLDGLRPGRHRVEVYSTDGYRPRRVRIYTGTLRLEPGTVNIAMVDVYRRMLRMRTRLLDERSDGAYADKGNDRGRKDDRSEYRDGDYEESRDDQSRNDRSGDYSDDVYGNNDSLSSRNNNNERDNKEGYGSFPRGRGSSRSDGYNTANILTQRDMDDLHTRISKLITDSDKESLMKSVLDNRSVYTDQVRTMLAWLSFESTRLDFAKWAYSHAADRQHYWKLEDVFTFSASKEEFNKAIRAR